MLVPVRLSAGRARIPGRRLLAALALAGLLVSATASQAQDSDPEPAIRRLVLDASRSLQSANAALFLGLVDRRSLGGFQELQDDLRALTAHHRIASSVAVESIEGGPEQWTASVDWLLELTPKLDPGPVERRRQTVRVSVRKRGKRWRIVDLAPPRFFVPSPSHK